MRQETMGGRNDDRDAFGEETGCHHTAMKRPEWRYIAQRPPRMQGRRSWNTPASTPMGAPAGSRMAICMSACPDGPLL